VPKRSIVAAALLLCLTALCGTGCGSGAAPKNVRASLAIGPAGGALAVPNGPMLTVPPDALARMTTITIEASNVGAPMDALTPVFKIEPAGTVLARPAVLTFAVPPSTAAASVYSARPSDPPFYETVETEVASGFASARVTQLGLVFAGAPCSNNTRCEDLGSCRAGITSCNRGTPICNVSGDLGDGIPCAAGKVCKAGVCAAAEPRTVTGDIRTPADRPDRLHPSGQPA